jgi:SanA protein
MKKKIKTFIRRFWKLCLGLVIVFTAVLLLSNYWVKKEARSRTYDSVEKIPFNHTGLVLGTSKKVRNGSENLFFKYRMEAAYELYNSGKINFIIVSGDNSEFYYNETRDMKKSLVKMGIPEDCIVEDFAGFSTLDSVLRAKEVFGQDSLTIISQQFHNERAIFIGKNHDIYALGFNAQKVPKRYGTMTMTREYFARVKAILDIYVFGTMPKFYKEKETFPNKES